MINYEIDVTTDTRRGTMLGFITKTYLMDISSISIVARLGLAILFGGLIGFEREKKNRAAGIRTHMLVCIGACLTMMTNQFIIQTLSYGGDPTRMGAQVISGIGFLGAGTILVTGQHQIKGLTTAAGLWASACLGLAIGIGFYKGAIIGFVVTVMAIVSFQRLDRIFYEHKRMLDVYVEFDSITSVKYLVKKVRERGERIDSLEVIKSKDQESEIGAVVTIGYGKEENEEQLLEALEELQGINFIEKLK